MEAAMRALLQNSLGEYVSGLDKIDVGKFPLTLRDMKLRTKKIQEDMEEEGNFPFDISDGKIGSISVSPGWMGTVEIRATDIVLNFSFSPMKAMRRAMQNDEGGNEEDQYHAEPHRTMAPPPPQPVNVPPRYCSAHGTSDKRVKVEPRFMECVSCHTKLQTNYAEFTLCPPCSEHQRSCMICGGSAPNSGSYVPAATLEQEHAQGVRGQPPGPPRPPFQEPRAQQGDPQRPPLPRHLQGIGEDAGSYRPSGRRDGAPPQDKYGDGLPAPPPPPPRRDVAAWDGQQPQGQQQGAWGSSRSPDDLPPPPPMQEGRRSGRPSVRDRDDQWSQSDRYGDGGAPAPGATPPGTNFGGPPPPPSDGGGRTLQQQSSWSGRGGPLGTGSASYPGPPGGSLGAGGPPGTGKLGGPPNGGIQRDPYAPRRPRENGGVSNLYTSGGGDEGSFMGILRNMDISNWAGLNGCMTATGAHGEGAQELMETTDRPYQAPEQVLYPNQRGPRQQRGGA